jgi:hypothetical protein
LALFLVRFREFLREGSSKTLRTYFAKSPCRKLFPKQSTKVPILFYFIFIFILSRFRVFLSDGSSKTLPKQIKTIVSKSFSKTIDKKSKTDSFSIFLNHVFGRFSVRGVQKHNASQPTPLLRSHKAQNESITATKRTQRKL